jgi:hypothetical protein
LDTRNVYNPVNFREFPLDEPLVFHEKFGFYVYSAQFIDPTILFIAFVRTNEEMPNILMPQSACLFQLNFTKQTANCVNNDTTIFKLFSTLLTVQFDQQTGRRLLVHGLE